MSWLVQKESARCARPEHCHGACLLWVEAVRKCARECAENSLETGKSRAVFGAMLTGSLTDSRAQMSSGEGGRTTRLPTIAASQLGRLYLRTDLKKFHDFGSEGREGALR